MKNNTCLLCVKRVSNMKDHLRSEHATETALAAMNLSNDIRSQWVQCILFAPLATAMQPEAESVDLETEEASLSDSVEKKSDTSQVENDQGTFSHNTNETIVEIGLQPTGQDIHISSQESEKYESNDRIDRRHSDNASLERKLAEKKKCKASESNLTRISIGEEDSPTEHNDSEENMTKMTHDECESIVVVDQLASPDAEHDRANVDASPIDQFVGKQHVCRVCQKSVDTSQFSNHIYREHLQVLDLFKCKLCNESKSSWRPWPVNKHAHSVHEDKNAVVSRVDEFQAEIANWLAQCFPDSPTVRQLNVLQQCKSSSSDLSMHTNLTSENAIEICSSVKKETKNLTETCEESLPNTAHKLTRCQLCNVDVMRSKLDHIYREHLKVTDLFQCKFCKEFINCLRKPVVDHAYRKHRDGTAVVSRVEEFRNEIDRYSQQCFVDERKVSIGKKRKSSVYSTIKAAIETPTKTMKICLTQDRSKVHENEAKYEQQVAEDTVHKIRTCYECRKAVDLRFLLDHVKTIHVDEEFNNQDDSMTSDRQLKIANLLIERCFPG